MVIKKSHRSQVTGRRLRDKKILITAGPTWVPIDDVRVISNIATGKTGILLAEKFRNLGARVTLVLGPICASLRGEAEAIPKMRLLRSFGARNDRVISLIRFRFFDELKGLIERELRLKKYDVVIHSAAVSDYRPEKSYRYKISSTLGSLKIKLVQTEKIIDSIKKIDPEVLLVGFKFIPDVGKLKLITEANLLMKRCGAELMVANTVAQNRYKAYIVDKYVTKGPYFSKHKLLNELINIINY